MTEKPPIALHMPEPDVTPDHAFVPPEPGVRIACRHVVLYDLDGRAVHCDLARAQHPIVEDCPKP